MIEAVLKGAPDEESVPVVVGGMLRVSLDAELTRHFGLLIAS